MASIQFIKPWLCAVLLTLLGCSTIKHTSTAETKQAAQTPKTYEQPAPNDDPFERDEPSVECFENEQAIKKAYERLKEARESILAALFLPSFSFYTVEHIKTGEKKTVFTENHLLPPPFDNESEWRIIKEDAAKIKTIVTCALMLELQKF